MNVSVNPASPAGHGNGEGYDPQFGARPLKRAVQEHILNPLSMRLLEGEFKPGDRIKVTARNDVLVFERK
jgi:ATP-dependent Clp protease ATP-binding subunit ClpB